MSSRPEPTIDLLRRVREGDERALDRIVAQNLEPLRRWATGRLPRGARDLRDTVDLVHETVLHALPKIKDIEHRGEGAVQAYFRQALANRLKNEYRRASRRPEIEEANTRIPADADSPLQSAMASDARNDYESALSSLSDTDRELVVLRLELDYEYASIAQATGRATPDAARMATVRAVARLAEAMRHAD